MSNKRRETVVFVLEDVEAAKPFWDAFRSGTAIYGMRPVAIGTGDQMTIPGELAEALRAIDPDSPDRRDLKELVETAERYAQGEAPPTAVSASLSVPQQKEQAP